MPQFTLAFNLRSSISGSPALSPVAQSGRLLRLKEWKALPDGPRLPVSLLREVRFIRTNLLHDEILRGGID